MRNTKVIAAFPACGKSYCFDRNEDYIILDSDSSKFSWAYPDGLAAKYRNPDFPKNYIVSNAFGTLEALSDSFMQKLSEKVQLMESSGILSSADVSLITENNYIQRKLFENFKGNAEQVTEDDIVEERELFKIEYAKEIGMDNEALSKQIHDEKEQSALAKEERDLNYNAAILSFEQQAKEYATSSVKWITILKSSIIALCTLFSIIVSAANLFDGEYQFNFLSFFLFAILLFFLVGLLNHILSFLISSLKIHMLTVIS